MAIVQSLFGKPSGKVAQLVFATWKGLGYVRQYVIPANPSTAAQVAVRVKFTAAVRFSKAILGNVLQVFVDPFLKSNSAFAANVGKCITAWAGGVDLLLVKIVEGTLESTPITGAVYAGTDVTVTWSSTVLGNGSPTDKACIMIYDAQNGVSFFNGTADRTDGTVDVTIGAGRTIGFCSAYLWFADDAAAPTVVSDSQSAQPTV